MIEGGFIWKNISTNFGCRLRSHLPPTKYIVYVPFYKIEYHIMFTCEPAKAIDFSIITASMIEDRCVFLLKLEIRLINKH